MQIEDMTQLMEELEKLKTRVVNYGFRIDFWPSTFEETVYGVLNHIGISKGSWFSGFDLPKRLVRDESPFTIYEYIEEMIVCAIQAEAYSRIDLAIRRKL